MMVSFGSESSGVEEGSDDVVGEVTEAEGGAAEVLETTVDGLASIFHGAAERRRRASWPMSVADSGIGV